jgi:chromodomain-helicase-DNA-binding protein 4
MNPKSSVLQGQYFTSADINGLSYLSQEDEGDASGGASDRDSDAEFEQMLAEAEEANKISAEADDDDVGGESNVEEESAGSGDTPPSSQAPNQAPVRRKAKTKIGNKSKKKKKTKTTSKFPGGDGEDGYEVCSETLLK